MNVPFELLSSNTEAASRPGYYQFLAEMVTAHQPDVIALQEVHSTYGAGCLLPPVMMPVDAGKRKYPIRVHQFAELKTWLKADYFCYFARQMIGLHDLEPQPDGVWYGQALFVRRCGWTVCNYHTDAIFGQPNQCNQEKIGGTPAGKVAISVLIEHRLTGLKMALTNVHGFWSMHGKKDLPSRFEQNYGINQHLGAVIPSGTAVPYRLLVGDLNYRSSMNALEDLRQQEVFARAGVILNHEFAITKTRTNHYLNWEAEPEADFIITTSELAHRAVLMKSELTTPADHAIIRARFVLN